MDHNQKAEAPFLYHELVAVSPIMYEDCEKDRKAFQEAREKLVDPRLHQHESLLVTACTHKVFRQSQEKCWDQFKAARKCLWDNQVELKPCYKLMMALRDCYGENYKLSA